MTIDSGTPVEHDPEDDYDRVTGEEDATAGEQLERASAAAVRDVVRLLDQIEGDGADEDAGPERHGGQAEHPVSRGARTEVRSVDQVAIQRCHERRDLGGHSLELELFEGRGDVASGALEILVAAPRDLQRNGDFAPGLALAAPHQDPDFVPTAQETPFDRACEGRLAAWADVQSAARPRGAWRRERRDVEGGGRCPAAMEEASEHRRCQPRRTVPAWQ
jgi:hypothetical protein